MHEWAEQYPAILTRASLRTALLSSHVDDVRQGTTILRIGMRFNHTTMEFVWSIGAEIEEAEGGGDGDGNKQQEHVEGMQLAMNYYWLRFGNSLS